MSFSAAEKATRHVFDTVGWHEVVSRLRRARGTVFAVATVLKAGRVSDTHQSEFVAELHDLSRQISAEAKGLSALLAVIGATPPVLSGRPLPQTPGRPYERMRNIGKSFVLGQLRAALSFVGKCGRNAPYIEARGGEIMTAGERATIEREIRQIRKDTSRLKGAVQGGG